MGKVAPSFALDRHGLVSPLCPLKSAGRCLLGGAVTCVAAKDVPSLPRARRRMSGKGVVCGSLVQEDVGNVQLQ